MGVGSLDGGSWEIWLRAAFAAALLGAIIYSAFK
jgi:hypothetical protein